jgi:hypothetical protein
MDFLQPMPVTGRIFPDLKEPFVSFFVFHLLASFDCLRAAD